MKTSGLDGKPRQQPPPQGRGPGPAPLPSGVARLCPQHVGCRFCFSSETGLSLFLEKDQHTLKTHLLIITGGKKETHRILNCILQMARKMSIEMNDDFQLRGPDTFLWRAQVVPRRSQAVMAWPKSAGLLSFLPCLLRKIGVPHLRALPALASEQMTNAIRPLLVAPAGQGGL